MSHFQFDWNISQHAPWLRKDGKSRLFSLHLTKVADPLNADAIWDQRTGGDRDMTDPEERYSNRRLLQALRAHCYTTTAYRDKAPQARNFTFSDVLIWIPPRLWRDADIENGEALFLMAERFRYQHELAFAPEQRFQNRPPNYCIMPLPGLPDHEVVCQFGLGVFLPNKDDVQTGNASIAKQGYQPEELPEWIFFEQDDDTDTTEHTFRKISKVVRPSGLYAAQSMLLVANTHHDAAIQSPLWLDGLTKGEMILNLNTNKPSAYGDEVHITCKQPSRSGRQTSCYFHQLGNADNGITLLLNRVSQTTVMEALRRSASTANTGTVIDDEEESLSGFTHIDLGDDLPDYIYQLCLTGIVLPRINRLKGTEALSHWELSLDCDGLPAHDEEEAVWLIRGGRDEQTGLQWKQKNSETWEALTESTLLPYPENQTRYLKPAALADKQFAILPLNSPPLKLPLSTQAKTIGRDIGENSPADYPLSILSQSSALIDHQGRQRGTMDSIGLSGEHLHIKLDGQKLQLQQLKSQSHIIQKNGSIRLNLTPKQNLAELHPGEGLIIGPLLFQYVEEFLPDRQE